MKDREVTPFDRLPAPGTLLVVMLLWGLTLVRPTLSNGDAPTYLVQILDLDVFLRTVHIGYFLTAAPLVHLLPGDPAWRINLVSLLWAIAGAAALLRLETRLDPTADRAGWSVLWCAAFPPVLMASTTAEVYPAQTALTLWALWLWGDNRPITAGLTWFAATTQSPAALAAFPLFWTFPAPRRRYARLLSSMLIPFGLMVWALSGDYLWGIRGLLTPPPGMDRAAAAVFRLSALPAAMGFALLFLAPGLASAVDGRWPEGRRLALATLAYTMTVWLTVDRFRDVPAHATTLCLLALFAARGARTWWHENGLLRLRRGLLLGCLALQIFLADQATRAQRRHEAAFAALARTVYTSIQDHGRVLGDFRTRRLYEWYAKGRTSSGITAPIASAPFLGRGTPVEFRLLTLPQPGALPPGARLERVPDGSWRYFPP